MAALRERERLRASDAGRVRRELLELSASWRRVLADDPHHARQIVASLLKGRVTYAPLEPQRWRLTGEGTLMGAVLARGRERESGQIRVPRRVGAPGGT
jgi:hypothetical protein